MAVRNLHSSFPQLPPKERRFAPAKYAKARHISVKHANQNLGAITLSLGVAIFPDQAANSQELVKAADVALYEAKRAGRDRVIASRADYGMP